MISSCVVYPQGSLVDTYAFRRGLEEFENSNFTDALDWFKRDLEKNPENGYSYLMISMIKYNNKELGLALTAIDKAINGIKDKDKSGKSRAYSMRGNINLALGDSIRALNDYTFAIQKNANDAEVYNYRAELYFELGRYNESAADYMTMTRLDPGNHYGYMGLGRNANIQKRWVDAINYFNYFIKLSPNYSKAYSCRAESFIGQGKCRKAADDIIKAIELDGDEKGLTLMYELNLIEPKTIKTKIYLKSISDTSNPVWLFCLGDLHFVNKEYKYAIQCFEKAYSLDSHSIILERMSNCYNALGIFNKALYYVDKAISINPDDLALIKLRADILSNQGDFKESLKERSRYIEYFPNETMAYLLRAEDYGYAKEFSKAIEDYNTATLLSEELSKSTYLLLKRGDAYSFIGNRSEAICDFEKIIELEKDSGLDNNSLTPLAFSGLGNFEKAIESMQIIIDNEKNNKDTAGVYYTAACVYARCGKKEEAIEFLSKAIKEGYHDVKNLLNDYDLDPIRECPAYLVIIKALENDSVKNGKLV